MALRKCCVGGFLRVVCQSHAVPDLVAKAVVAKSTALLDNTQSEAAVGVGDVCFFLTMRCFNDAMFSNS